MITQNNILESLDYTSQRVNSDQCSPWEILSMILTFALDKFVKKGILFLPKWWNIFKWIPIGKFMYDLVQLIIFCVRSRRDSNAKLNPADFKSKDTISIIHSRHKYMTIHMAEKRPFIKFLNSRYNVRSN